MKELELIRLYCYLCDCNDNVLCIYHQRFSRNSAPTNEKLTDVELLTIYLYCRRFENKHIKAEIYDYANRYLRSWFPDLPAYANFNARLNNLSNSIPYLINLILNDLQNTENQYIDASISLIDSMPIMLCSGKRKGKVAPCACLLTVTAGKVNSGVGVVLGVSVTAAVGVNVRVGVIGCGVAVM